jgi:hypothetical protein
MMPHTRSYADQMGQAENPERAKVSWNSLVKERSPQPCTYLVPVPACYIEISLLLRKKWLKANIALPQIVLRQPASAGSWYVAFLILTSVVRRDADVDQVLHHRDSYSCTVTASYMIAGLQKTWECRGRNFRKVEVSIT